MNLDQYSNKKEEEIQNYWKENNIQKLVDTENSKFEKKYFLCDGPPYATGYIHIGTALNKILKDTTIRYWRMNNHHVHNRAGYDVHGVPIEQKIEKDHGFKCPEDIENFGVKKFVSECRNFATQFIDEMGKQFQNLGVWMDFEDPYLPLSNEYIESIWYAFKKADEKNLLYLGEYPLHVCTSCGTGIAFNEIEYKKLTDPSVYVKFKVNNEENTYLIIWTTTPWTLIDNMGVMVHPNFEYSYVKVDNEKWIIAKERIDSLLSQVKKEYTIEKTVKGSELENLTYVNPLSKNLKLENIENAYRVILYPKYVNLDDGTGLVHCAPGHGKEDWEAGRKTFLPIKNTVSLTGEFNSECGKYAGLIAKKDDREIIKDLRADNSLIHLQQYTHDYPICWRHKTPLLQMTTSQWFLKVSSIQQKMKDQNKEVNWLPSWGQDRFDNWLECLSDWPISRKRYWGTPIPIWLCEKCGNKKVVGSLNELSELVKLPEDLNLHKPEVDYITIPCSCGEQMKRVPEVLDVWFDSGAASWGSLQFPHRTDLFEQFWPADINIEGNDQFRGWWNSQMILSTICFNKSPFKSVPFHGMVLGMGKIKMSKSLGNIIQPEEAVEKYNRDYLRFALVSKSTGEDFEFSWDTMKDTNKMFNVFWNAFKYSELYLGLDFYEKDSVDTNNPEDKWILSKFQTLVKNSRKYYEGYTYYKTCSEISRFVLEDLSRTYIKLIRDRIGTNSSESAKNTLNYILTNLLKLMAPITPHVSEFVYQSLKKEGMNETIHLYEIPKANEELLNLELENEMQTVLEITKDILFLREGTKLRRRWSLKEVAINSKVPIKNLRKVLKDMCNVKEVTEILEKPSFEFVSKETTNYTVYLNTETTPKLKEEWELKELTRKIQDLRKQNKLNPKDVIKLELDSDNSDFLNKYKETIEKDTNTKIIQTSGDMKKLLNHSFYIKLKQ